MSEGKMLQLVIFAIVFGLAINGAGESGMRVGKFFRDLNVVVIYLVTIVMRLTPIGVFALLATLFAAMDWNDFGALLAYFFTALLVMLLQAFVVYPVILGVLANLDPFAFLRKMRTVMMFAFSTSSSNATLPVTLTTVEQRLGVNNSVAAFTVPLGATINMDGAAILQGVATVFIANVYGVDLTISQLASIMLMVVLASIGAAGVPGVALVILATVLTQVGLPLEGIAIVLGVDRLLDMVRTAVNVTGDAVVSCVVAHSEHELNLSVYNDPNAGQTDLLPVRA